MSGRQWLELFRLRREGWKLKDLAKRYGLSVSYVGEVCRRYEVTQKGRHGE